MSRRVLAAAMGLLLLPVSGAGAATLIVEDASPAAPNFEGEGGQAGLGCVWELMLPVQAYVEACEWPRLPIDDVVDTYVAKLDALVLANSEPPLGMAGLELKKQQARQSYFGSTTEERARQCSLDTEPAATIWAMRQRGSEAELAQFSAMVDAIPLDKPWPIEGPCL